MMLSEAVEGIGTEIRVLRIRAGLTQSQLGKLLHVPQETVSTWETGRYHPEKNHMKKLSQILNLNTKAIKMVPKIREEISEGAREVLTNALQTKQVRKLRR